MQFALLEAILGGGWGLFSKSIPFFFSPSLWEESQHGLIIVDWDFKPELNQSNQLPMQLISFECKRKCVSVRRKCSTASLKGTLACGCDVIDGTNPT